MDIMLPVNTIAPLVLMVSLGFLLRKLTLLDNHTRLSMNKVVFRFLIPAMLFYNLYKSDLSGLSVGSAVTYSVIFAVAAFIIMLIIVPPFIKDRSKCSVFIQGVYRGNVVLLGVPIVVGLCGAENVGLYYLLSALVVPIQNIESVIMFEIFRGGKPKIRTILLNIVKNPLVIGSAAGILLKTTGLTLPLIIDKFVSDLARIATPVSLLILGAFLNFKVIGNHIKLLVSGIIGRLIVFPAFFVAGAIILGFRGIELVSLMTLTTMPAAVSTFTMAEQMGGDPDYASSLVIFGTTFSVFTIMGWIYLLQGLSLI